MGSLDTLDVPATVEAVLAARIDRLGEREKLVLYAAAVIGLEFPRPLLEVVCETKGPALDAALVAYWQPRSHTSAQSTQSRSMHSNTRSPMKSPCVRSSARHVRPGTGPLPRQLRRLGLTGWTNLPACSRIIGLKQETIARGAMACPCSAQDPSHRYCCLQTPLDAGSTESFDASDAPERTKLLLEAYPELINTLDRLGAAPAKSEAIFHEAILLAQSAGDVRTEALLEAIYSQLTSSAQNDLAGLITHAKRAVMLADAQGDLPIRLLARHFLGRGHGVRGEWTESICILDQNIAIGGGDSAVKIEVLGWIPYLNCWNRSAVLCGIGDLRGARVHRQLPRVARPGRNRCGYLIGRYRPDVGLLVDGRCNARQALCG